MGKPNGVANGKSNGTVSVSVKPLDERTDLRRWRLSSEDGRHGWSYLSEEQASTARPQSDAEKYHLGLLPVQALEASDIGSSKPLKAASNALSFLSRLQLPEGHWACEYGGPMFLLPGLVIAWYVTETPIPDSYSIEIKRYLFARQNPTDGGWGLHVEGESTAFGTTMTYVTLRILGTSEEDVRMLKARNTLHGMGGALYAPHWGKFWLSVLGVMSWDAVNPCPPELWLLPDWIPFAPWRWWIHMRQVYLPMSFIYSHRHTCPLTPLTRSLRSELYPQPYATILFSSHRNTINPRDNYHPKSLILLILFWFITNIWTPFLCPRSLVRRAERWAYRLIQYEDANTDYQGLGPVSSPMHLVAAYIHDGPDSETVRQHRARQPDFLWMTSEGILMNGTDGVQTWDTAFTIQAGVEAGLVTRPEFRPLFTRALNFLDKQQIRENCVDQEVCYRHRRKGAWAFSTREQGYTVSDTTSEALKAVLLLQHTVGYPELVSQSRIRDAIDTLISMQNPGGGFGTYELKRGSEYMEYLNAAEVFGRIMIEYIYPECTTAVLTALSLFSTIDSEYRAEDIARVKNGALEFIRRDQRPDGSWYGSWGICFTYAGMFALESLASVGEIYTNSPRARQGCEFLLSKQREDGGWGESYRSCETGKYVQHERSQVVQTCWAVLGLMEAGYPDRQAIERGIRLVMKRQQVDGRWEQEAIEGVFNKSCMISYPNYKFHFPIKALGMFARKFGNEPLL